MFGDTLTGSIGAIPSMRPIPGKMTRNFERPEWGPLVELAPDHIQDFMWMFEVELANGVRLHAYKHWETRRYLHLDHGGRAFVFLWNEELTADDDGEYQEVDPGWLLELVLAAGSPDGASRRLVFLGDDEQGKRISGRAIGDFLGAVAEAMLDETFDRRTDRYLAWTQAEIDEAAWKESVELMDQMMERMIAITQKGRERVERGTPAFPARGDPMTIAAGTQAVPTVSIQKMG